MEKRFGGLVLLALMLAALLLGSCGGGAGAPGSYGSEDTGITIRSVDISRETPDIDVYQNATLCDGEPELPLTREDATMTIDALKLNVNSTFDPFPAQVEECTITYKKANEDPSSPLLESLTIYPNCKLVSASNNTCNVTLIDIQRKQNYWNALNNGTNLPAEYPTHYVARYICKYTNNVGNSGSFQVEYDFWLADFIVCD